MHLHASPVSRCTSRQVLRLQRQADKLYDAGEEEAASKAHKPNLLNTIIWLVETAQQVSAMPAPTSPYTSVHLRTSPYISVHLRTSPYISVHLRASPCISVHLSAAR